MSTKPSTGHTAVFRHGAFPVEPDGRITTQTVNRNAKPVIDGLSPLLGGLSGNALEIGSGTGQHIIRFARAFPALNWTPSEPDAIHRTSIDAWASHDSSPTNAAITIDAAADWTKQPEVQAIAPLSLILSLNVIHISPWSVSQGIIAGAGKSLDSGGLLAFYGPFRENGQHTAQGNSAFDQGLQADNPDWGVRDIADISSFAQENGLAQHSLVEMPENNRLLVLCKR